MILITWLEIPEAMNFYLLPEDHEMAEVFKTANNYFINGNYAGVNFQKLNSTKDEKRLAINNALEKIVTYMYDWSEVDGFSGINPDIEKYKVDNEQPVDQHISMIVTTGMFL